MIDSLVHGNFKSEGALELLDTVERKLAAGEVDASELDNHRALKLPPGSTTVYRPPVPSAENVNSAASVYYDVGTATDHELLARLSLFAQIAKVPVFSTLRTKEQLGYIVRLPALGHEPSLVSRLAHSVTRRRSRPLPGSRTPMRPSASSFSRSAQPSTSTNGSARSRPSSASTSPT